MQSLQRVHQLRQQRPLHGSTSAAVSATTSGIILCPPRDSLLPHSNNNASDKGIQLQQRGSESGLDRIHHRLWPSATDARSFWYAGATDIRRNRIPGQPGSGCPVLSPG